MKVTIVLGFIAVGFAFSAGSSIGVGASLGGLKGGLNIGLGSSHFLPGSGYSGHKHGGIAAGLGAGVGIGGSSNIAGVLSSSSSGSFGNTGQIAFGSGEAAENSFSHKKVGSGFAGLDIGLDVGLAGSFDGHKQIGHDTAGASSGSIDLSSSSDDSLSAISSAAAGGSLGVSIGGGETSRHSTERSSSAGAAGTSIIIDVGSNTKLTGVFGHGHKSGHRAHGFEHTSSAEGPSSEVVSHSHRHNHGNKHGHIHGHRHGHSGESNIAGGESNEYGSFGAGNSVSHSSGENNLSGSINSASRREEDGKQINVNPGSFLSSTSGASVGKQMNSQSFSHTTSYGGSSSSSSQSSYINIHKSGYNNGGLGHGSSTLDILAEKNGHGHSAGLTGGSSSNNYLSTSNAGGDDFSASSFKDSKYEGDHRLIVGSKESRETSRVGALSGQSSLYSGGKFGHSGSTISKDKSVNSGLKTGLVVGLGLSESSLSSSSANKDSSLGEGAGIGLGAGTGQNSNSKISSSSIGYETSALGNVNRASSNKVGIGFNTGVGLGLSGSKEVLLLSNSVGKKASASNGLETVSIGQRTHATGNSGLSTDSSSSSLSGSKVISNYGAGNAESESSEDIGVNASFGGSHGSGATGLLNHVGGLVAGVHTDAAGFQNSAASAAETTGLLGGLLGVKGSLGGYKHSVSPQASAGGYAPRQSGNYAGPPASSSGSAGGLSLGLGFGIGR